MSWRACYEPVCEDESSVTEPIIEAKARDLGGFSVRRVLPSGRRRMVGPFIFFDHIGPTQCEPGGGIDVRPHPHIGIATITYLFAGKIMHRDSLGCVQSIDAGAVNWMTAGRGIVHSERLSPEERAKGALVHGIQSRLALPKEFEENQSAFQHQPAHALPVIECDGARLRVIAGEAYGAHAPTATLSPLFYVDATLPAGCKIPLPDEYADSAVYVVEGDVTLAARRVQRGRMMVLDGNAGATIQAHGDSRAMFLGGAPLDGERHIWWNFVSSSEARIERAKDDWKNGRFAPVPGDAEYIPLPEN